MCIWDLQTTKVWIFVPVSCRCRAVEGLAVKTDRLDPVVLIEAEEDASLVELRTRVELKGYGTSDICLARLLAQHVGVVLQGGTGV